MCSCSYIAVLKWAFPVITVENRSDWLDESDLDLLMEELGPIDTMWEKLGWTLDISDEQLKDTGTQCSYHGNHGDALWDVLQKWLPGPSHWGGIVHALRSIRMDGLCSELNIKYGG